MPVAGLVPRTASRFAMKKIRLIVAYDGTDFSGFQRQPGQRTIQGTLEEELARVTGEAVEVHGSGRTDAGVHALGQVCHFETSSPIPADKYAHILNRSLPRDVIVISSAEADAGFHARKSAYWKTYRYQVDTGAVPDLLERRFRAHVPGRFDLDAMRRAASFLVGTHDFTSFCSTKTVVENRVRTIHRCLVEEDRLGFRIEVTGTGFLYNMVRIIAGTLAEAGRGRLSPERIPEILAARDRTKAGPTFPPEGLLLVKVGYEPWSENAPSL